MTPKVRELNFKVADGQHEAFPILYNINRFKYHERMLKWLVDNGFTGKEFLNLYKYQFKGSWLELGRWIVKMVNNHKGHKPIIYGKDWA